MVDNVEVIATLNVERSRQFRRDGFDVHSDVMISFTMVMSELHCVHYNDGCVGNIRRYCKN